MNLKPCAARTLSRNLLNNRRWQRLIIGNTMGSLFIRSYERGERIHQAMLAQGYRGSPRSRRNSPSSRLIELPCS